MKNDDQSNIAQRVAVEDAVVRMFVATDEHDWPTLESCFTDPFVLDMTSMAGGQPATMTPQQVAQAWSDGFKPLDHVHHQVGNFRTELAEGKATLKCYGVALHHRTKASGLKTRIFVGTYEIDLIPLSNQWRISRLMFKLKFIDGNVELEK